jgi:hypothetical protein
MAISVGIATTLVPLPGQVALAADPIDTMVTSYQPVISESIDANGFKHPGVGFTKDMLENMRAEVLAKKEPWNTHFNMMIKSAKASRTPGISNVNGSDPTKPRIYGLDSQGAEGIFIADALTAYTQAILYYVTGDSVYRANAMRIIRLYEQMDPSKYVYYTDSHIHTGIPLQRMTGAAEILRYTSSPDPALAWTDDDTQKFSADLVTPVIQTFDNCNCRFMNQHLYTTIAKMSGSIFMGDRDGYNQAVEWFMVNKDAPDPAWTGSIKQLFRTVTKNDATGEAIPPQIQHVEMGRDQAHGAGDLTNSEILARLMMAQGTKVDPVAGTPSTDSNAVGPYEFMDDRLLAVHELFGKWMVGYDIPWVPVAMSVNPDGSIRAMYTNVSWSYRGRLTQNSWEAFYYYKYVRGLDVEHLAPNYTTIYAKRKAYNWDGADGGGDFWLAIPKAAEVEGSKYLGIPIIDPYREVEDRFTAYDSNAVAQTDGTTGYVSATATPDGTRIAVYSYNGATVASIGFRIRTNGQAMMDVSGMPLALPNTRGQWRYFVVPMNLGDFLPLTITGAGTTVDIDHINVKSSTLLSPPVFKSGNSDTTAYTYAGATIATTLDLSATDPAAGDVVTYNMDNLPQGATFDTSTGAFSWKPTQAGTYTFIAEASDGTSVTTKRVTIVVGADRQSVVSAVTAPVKPDTLYVTSTKTAYDSAYADMQNTIGSSTDDTYFQKLAALRTAVSGLQELTPLLKDGSMDYTNLFFKTNLVTNFGDWAANGVDNNTDSFIAFTIARDDNRTMTLDFGPSFKVAATAFQILPRTSFPERVGGVTVFASNDNENWTRITPGETAGIESLQTLNVQDDQRTQRYRFFKISMIDLLWSYNILELGEFRIFGTRYETVNKLTSVSLSSDQALKGRVVPGNTIKVSFQSTEPINNVNATIQGEPATVTTTDNLNWTATLPVKASTAPGPVKLLLNYKTADGKVAEPVLFPTDSTSLVIAHESDVIQNVPTIATLIDSTTNRSAATTLQNVNALFDANLATGSDFRNGSGGSGSGAWVVFDFKDGNQVTLTSTEVISRQDGYYGRINGTVFQGSNDNASWTTLTPAAKSTMDWQMLPVASLVPYRYIRIYNPNAWYGNMNEVRLHGSLHAADVTAPVTTAAAPQGTVTTDATVNFTATDNQGGSGVAATYYTVDGGAQQTGTAVTLTTSGTHTVSYWSKDWAGNSEQPHTVTVAIDKSVDVTSFVSIARSGLTVNRFTSKYTGTVTIKNTGGQTLAGTLHLRLEALTAGVTLDNQTGVKDGVPYIALPVTSLAPGQSVTLTTTFSNPNKVGIAYTPALFSIQ